MSDSSEGQVSIIMRTLDIVKDRDSHGHESFKDSHELYLLRSHFMAGGWVDCESSNCPVIRVY